MNADKRRFVASYLRSSAFICGFYFYWILRLFSNLTIDDEREAAEVIIKIGGGLIERIHLEKWIKRMKIKENMDILRSLFVEQ